MFINWKLKELNLKIVYYGPALSGKTTNLQFVHARTNPKLRGDLVSLKTREDRTIIRSTDKTRRERKWLRWKRRNYVSCACSTT